MVRMPNKPQKSQRVELNEQNASKCLCPGCPTYRSSPCPQQKEELIYCSTGATDCSLEMLGCLCINCPIFRGYDLRLGYFCAFGEAVSNGFPRNFKAP